MGEVLNSAAIIRSISFILVVFGIDTLLGCKKKPWLAIVGLALLAVYYIQGMFTGVYSAIYVDVGVVFININLILLYRKTNDPVINWIRETLNAEVVNPKSPLTEDDASRIMQEIQSRQSKHHT